MKINKKLSTAIVLSLMMGVYGTASAAVLYGASESASNLVSDLKVTGYATTDDKEAIASGAAYTVISGPWEHVYGGYLYEGNEDNASVENNIVTINSSDSVGGYVCGGYIVAGKGNATGNTVIVKNVDDSVNIYGGCIELFAVGNANNNIVNVSGGKMSVVDGGFTLNGSAVGNHVNVTGGKMLWVDGGLSGFYGEATGTFYVSSNIVKISGAATEVAYHVSGGSIQNGDALNNETIVKGGTIGEDVYGGYVVYEGDATGNKVNISGGTIGFKSDGSPSAEGGNVYGGNTADGKAESNTVAISGGKISRAVYGGYTEEGAATGNTVSINGAGSGATERVQITGKVYGGKSDNGAANNNKVGVVDSTGALVGAATNFTAQVVYGGYGTTGATGNKVWLGEGAIASGVYGGNVDFSNGSGNANNNEVKIMNGASVTLGVTGGNATKGEATKNTVVIDSSTVGSYVIGGMSDRRDATENIVTINNSELGYQVYGGLATGNNANAKGNTVNIGGDSTRINSIIYGGQSDRGIAGGTGTKEGNIVTVSGGQFRRAIFGGASAYSDAINNTVNFEKGTIKGDIYGGSGSDIDDNGGTKWIGSGNAIGNTVNITGGKIDLEGSEGGNVYGGYTLQGNVSENTVTIDGGEIAKDVYGGKTESGDAIKNVVEMNNATVNGTSRGGRAENGAANENIIRVTNSTTNDSVSGGNSVNGTANKNIAEITDSTIKGNVFGAWSKTGAQENQVTITGSSILHDVYGSYALAGNANSNSVAISGGTIGSSEKFVYGGYVHNEGNATGNTVTITDGTISSVVTGGRTDTGIAGGENATDGNKVTITGGTVNNAVYGGSSSNSSAINNSVEINGSAAKITGNVYGGSSWGSNGIAKGNKVDVKIGTLNKNVYGGFSGDSTAEENTVNVSGGTIGDASDLTTGNVYGGYSVNGDVKSNTVTISGDAEIERNVYGGYSQNGAVTDNTVNISGGTIEWVTLGGYSFKSDASSNTVIVSDGTFKDDVYGGYSQGGHADGNSVTIFGGTIGDASLGTGNVYGGYASAGSGISADNNIVNLGGYKDDAGNISVLGKADVLGTVFGGGNVEVNGQGNTLNVYSVGNEVGGLDRFQNMNFYIPAAAKAGDVMVDVTNTATVEGTVNIIGFAEDKLAKDETLYMVKANNIEGEASYAVDGASVKDGEKLGYASTNANGVNVDQVLFTANAKEISLTKKDTFLTGTYIDKAGVETSKPLVLDSGAAAYADIYGAYSEKGSTPAVVLDITDALVLSTSTIHGSNVPGADTTLNVKANGVKVGGIDNFANMNFYIPADATAGSTMLTVGTDVDLSNVKVAAGFHNDTTLGYGDKVILIDAPSVIGMDGVSEVKVDDTDFTEYDVMVYQGDAGMNQVESGATTLVAEMANMELKENSKILAETIIAGATVISDGSDMLAGAGLDSAVSAIAADLETGAPSGKMSMFGAISGNKSKVHTGSHVDVKGWNMNLGFAKELKNKDGKMIIGPVVEYGRGDYDSYLDNGYHGEGNSHYVGGGVMAKQINNNGNYFEGSLRSGKLTNEFKSTGGSYDHDVTYLAGHIGLGHVQKMNEKNSMDYYAKYFHTHVDGDDIKVSAKGKDLDMTAESMTSARLRVGTRLNHKMSAKSSYYIGFAWQREFSGTAEASLAGKEIASPSMKGNSGFMELGVKLFDSSRYDLDLGGFGSVGKKEGAGFNFNFNWKF